MKTKIGPSVKFQGEFQGQEDMIIEGNIIDSVIESTKDLIIEKSAILKANLKARNITVNGKIKGNVKVKDKLEITATGEIIGNIKTKVISIAPGGGFIGKCQSNLIDDQEILADNLDKVNLNKADKKNPDIYRGDNSDKKTNSKENKTFLNNFFNLLIRKPKDNMIYKK